MKLSAPSAIFADDIKLCGAFDTLEERNVNQADLDRLELWAYANVLKFNKPKFKVQHMHWGNSKHKYRVCNEWIESRPVEKGLRVLVDEKLRIS